MKKTGLIALLLMVALAVTGCGVSGSYADLKIEDYVALGEYKGLTYTSVDTTATERQIDEYIQTKMFDAGYTPVGTVQKGDICNIDYKGMKDGVAFNGGSDQGYDLEIGSGSFIAGFEEGLIGAEVGSTVNLDLTFPENYGSADLAGQAVVFEVKINYIANRLTYEITDEIVRKLDSDTKTVDEYRTKISNEVKLLNEKEAEENLRSTLWSKVVEEMTLVKDIPQTIIDDATSEIIERYEMLALQYAYDSLDEFLTANNTTMEYFNQQAKAYGQAMATSFMSAYAIANQEGFSVSDELFNEVAKEEAIANGFTDVNKYIKEEGKDAICDQIILDYAIQFVVDNAVAK